MDINQTYAIAIGGAFLILFLSRFRHSIFRFIRPVQLLLVRLAHVRVLHRFNYIGPWHLNTILLLVLFLSLNVYLTFCTGLLRLVSAEEASVRAANLSLVNLVPTLAGPSQSFLASIFGVARKTFQKIHRSLALMSFLLLIFHIITAIVERNNFSLRVRSNIWALAAALCLLALIALTPPLFRKPYELFARAHQFLAIVLPILIWQHLTPHRNVYFFLLLGAYPTALVPQLGLLVYRNATGRLISAENVRSLEEAEKNTLRFCSSIIYAETVDGPFNRLWHLEDGVAERAAVLRIDQTDGTFRQMM